jgi:uncharacterized protein (DUF2236 family)
MTATAEPRPLSAHDARDDGYFPRGSSMLRRVMSHRAVGLLYGQRALGIGALAPLNFIGTRRHTRAIGTPFQRLARTGVWFETIYFGSRAEADKVLRAVRGMHEKVRGEIPEAAGPFPAGTPYSAMDAELMLWTMAVMADSAEVFYELFVRDLSAAEKDSLWAEWILFAELFGMPRDAAPPTYGDFREWYAARLRSDDMFLTEEARFTGHAVMFQIPTPLSRKPAMEVHNLVMLGSLPPRVRELYGLRYTPVHAVGYRAAVTALRPLLRVTPAPIRRGRNTATFDLVADSERALVTRGRPVPGALS